MLATTRVSKASAQLWQGRCQGFAGKPGYRLQATVRRKTLSPPVRGTCSAGYRILLRCHVVTPSLRPSVTSSRFFSSRDRNMRINSLSSSLPNVHGRGETHTTGHCHVTHYPRSFHAQHSDRCISASRASGNRDSRRAERRGSAGSVLNRRGQGIARGNIRTRSRRNTTSSIHHCTTDRTLPPGTSPLKAIENLPGVNFQSADPYGAYEWSTRIVVRGFNQNQLGFTLDGVPLGDMTYGNHNGLHVSRAIPSETVARVACRGVRLARHRVDQQSRRCGRILLR